MKIQLLIPGMEPKVSKAGPGFHTYFIICIKRIIMLINYFIVIHFVQYLYYSIQKSLICIITYLTYIMKYVRPYQQENNHICLLAPHLNLLKTLKSKYTNDS
jgi:hypothetical protein